MSERRDDLPKLVAAITLTIPKIALGTGFAFLKMKRKARKSARIFEKGLISNGLSSTMAHELAVKYESDLSIRKMMSGFSGGFTKLKRRGVFAAPVQPDH